MLLHERRIVGEHYLLLIAKAQSCVGWGQKEQGMQAVQQNTTTGPKGRPGSNGFLVDQIEVYDEQIIGTIIVLRLPNALRPIRCYPNPLLCSLHPPEGRAQRLLRVGAMRPLCVQSFQRAEAQSRGGEPENRYGCDGCTGSR